MRVYRDAVTGRFVTREYAVANPSTTVRDAVTRPDPDWYGARVVKFYPGGVIYTRTGSGSYQHQLPDLDQRSQECIQEVWRSRYGSAFRVKVLER